MNFQEVEDWKLALFDPFFSCTISSLVRAIKLNPISLSKRMVLTDDQN